MADLLPLEQLASYEERGHRHVVNPVAEKGRREYWRAVSFRVGGVQLLVDENDVDGLLTLPEVTVIPGAKRWMAGIANVRGELLPIVDFGSFLFNVPTERTRQSHVLVVRYQDERSGLIVDQTYGMRRFPVDAHADVQMMDAAQPLKAVLSGSFEQDGTIFHVMEVQKLVDRTEFMQAAAQ